MNFNKTTKTISAEVVYSFSFQGMGGNPAGVVLDAAGLRNDEKQAIATQMNLSETAFLEKTDKGAYALSFYTPVRPIENCGHATIATFAFLRIKGIENRSSVKVVISGKEVIIHYDGSGVYMEQAAPAYTNISDDIIRESVGALNIANDALSEFFRPQIVDTGNRFLLLGLKSKEQLAMVKPNLDSILNISESENIVGFYVFSVIDDYFLASARMFAPRYGISEESATGMAAGPLAAVLIEKLNFTHNEFKIGQGEFMTPPSPSEIKIRSDLYESKIKKILVGGEARIAESRLITYETV